MFSARLPVQYLKARDAMVTREPAVITTVLGSCICVTMFCRSRKIAGIFHAFLPSCTCPGHCQEDCSCCPLPICPDPCCDPFRYVACSVQELFRRVVAAGGRPGTIEAKVFGGADSMAESSGASHLNVGMKNVKTVLRALRSSDLSIQESDLGGTTSRRIFFNTSNGSVIVKRFGHNRGSGFPGRGDS